MQNNTYISLMNVHLDFREGGPATGMLAGMNLWKPGVNLSKTGMNISKPGINIKSML